RIKALIENGINLYAYHLPLDVHQELGNNAQLADQLGIKHLGGLEPGNPHPVAVYGEFTTALTGDQLASRMERVINRKPLN
ncbi:Nif3-like dinuclear metal center hexameric protein, partial [Photobacterium sp. R1]